MDEQTGQPNPIDDIYTDPTRVVETAKMQISFWEKLVVLDASTLALSFTASGFFKGHLIGDGGIGYLAAAWRLLFVGIVFSLVAQWLTISGVPFATGAISAMRVLSLILRKKENATQEERQLVRTILADTPRIKKTGKYILGSAAASGAVGLFLSIAAFYWLYRFAEVNTR